MRRSRKPIRIASRQSNLARLQTQSVGDLLARLHRGVTVEYLWLSSDGDGTSDAARQAVASGKGLKGMFTRGIERSVLDRRCDIAVHSLKDLPTEETSGLRLAAIPARADARDCLISRGGFPSLAELPQGATLGTSSPRRAAQVKRIRPDIRIVPLRGNEETRVRKVLEEGACDATLLAAAGLIRSGLSQHAQHPIDPDIVLPAAGQGALAIQCAFDDHATLIRCLPINHAVTAAAVHAERQVIAGLEGDCHSPIAVYAESADHEGKAGYRLRARVLSIDGVTCLEVDDIDTVKGVRKLVQRVLASLLDQGAAKVLRQARQVVSSQSLS